jgi:hypothetical protein
MSGFRPVFANEITHGRTKSGTVVPARNQPSNVSRRGFVDTQLLEARRISVATTIVGAWSRACQAKDATRFSSVFLDSAVTRENQSNLPPIPATGLNADGQQMRANTVTIDGVDAIDNTIWIRESVRDRVFERYEIADFGGQLARVLRAAQQKSFEFLSAARWSAFLAKSGIKRFRF